MDYKNFIYMEERRFIFAYVPKVACSNWKALLRYMMGKEDWLNTKMAHDKVNGGLRYLDFSNPQDLNLLTQPGIRKYAMVRDPYSRTLSAYLNKIENRLPLKSESENEDHFCKVVRAIDQFRQDKLDASRYQEITFEVFLLWLQDGSSWFTKDEHWAPQTTLLRHPQVSFDILGRFETLSEDASRILSEMGCDQVFPSQKDVKFAPTNAKSKVEQYFDDACYALVDDIFSGDFDSFGYSQKDSGAVFMGKPSSLMPNKGETMNATQEERPPVIDEISPNDWMWKGNKNTDVYMSAGWSVGRVLKGASVIIEKTPERVLDFGCGHGRVMRWIRAVFPEATIVASDRVRDGVDFCAKTFDAQPVYSNDAYEGIGLGGNFDMIWLGSVYTHLPMNLWHKLTRMLVNELSPDGVLAFSFAGPFVAQKIIEGERNKHAEVSEQEFEDFLSGYRDAGFGYARHEGVGDREWGRSIISHARLFDFLCEENLSIVSLGERLYDNRQDIVIVRRQSQ